MRKIILATAAVAAVTAPVALSVAPASAASGNPACITRAEFSRIHNGMSLARVKIIVGSSGRLSLSSPPMSIRSFKTCTPFHVSNVSFWSGRVQSKLYI